MSRIPILSRFELYKSNGKGWQSEPNLLYPQHVVLEPLMREGTISVRFSKIRLLVYESKIPQKIELFLAKTLDERQSRKSTTADDGNDDDGDGENNNEVRTLPFRRLGYITLSKNIESDRITRELKSISLEGEVVSQVKFLIHSP